MIGSSGTAWLCGGVSMIPKLSDTLHLAQSDETRARVLLAEGKLVEAEKIARGAMRTLGASDHASLLAEALITHGVTLACLDHPLESKVSFEQAMNVAERAGDFESAGIAALTLIEQLGPTLSGEEVLEAVDRAGTLLDRSEDLSTVKRLARAAFDALFMPQSVTPEAWERFSLPDAIHRYRSRWIRLALEASDGSITKASKLLGIQHHQSLGYLIKHEHPELLEARRPIRTRRRSYLFSPPKGSKKAPAGTTPVPSEK